jgi:hypothetical protein
MAHKYIVHKDICLTDVINAGIDIAPATVVEWLEEMTHFGPDEIIDWLDDVEFRRFAHRTGLTNKLVSAGFIKIVEPDVSVGTYYQSVGSGEVYLLAQVDAGKVALISLDTGNRWRDPVRVKNAHAITEAEMANIKTHLILTRLISDPVIKVV